MDHGTTANVIARQTELESEANTPSGSRNTKTQSVKGTLQFLHIVEKLKVTNFVTEKAPSPFIVLLFPYSSLLLS